MNESLTVIIPAFNEEKNIQRAITDVIRVISPLVADFELIVIDDGSTDETGKIIDRVAGEIKNIRTIHHRQKRGFGTTFKEGIRLARKFYITGFPGDCDTSPDLLKDFMKVRKSADIISAYTVNPQERKLLRRIISDSFVLIVNTIFGLHLRYYNGYFLSQTRLVRQVPLDSRGFTVFAELKVKLLKRGKSLKEIPFKTIERTHGVSKAVSPRSMIDTISATVHLIIAVYLQRG